MRLLEFLALPQKAVDGVSETVLPRLESKCPVVVVAQYLVLASRELRRNCTWKMKSHLHAWKADIHCQNLGRSPRKN